MPTANIPLPSSSSFLTMATPAPASPAAASPTVQHVAKKSSDQLLQKFSHLDSPSSPKFKSKRRISVAQSHCRSPSHAGSSALVERRSLLPPAAARRSTLLRQLGIARARLKARDIRNRSLFGTLEKTWRSTVEGASRVFMEKHYHRHKRLINDIV